MIWWGKVDKMVEIHLLGLINGYQPTLVDNNLLNINFLHTYPQFFQQVDKSLWMKFYDFKCG